MQCTICRLDINENDDIIKFECDNILHYKCGINLNTIKELSHITKCPNCRNQNIIISTYKYHYKKIKVEIYQFYRYSYHIIIPYDNNLMLDII